jgi:hypothetical protein
VGGAIGAADCAIGAAVGAIGPVAVRLEWWAPWAEPSVVRLLSCDPVGVFLRFLLRVCPLAV